MEDWYKRSKENGSKTTQREFLEKLSVTFYITIFPKDMTEKGLWKLFE